MTALDCKAIVYGVCPELVSDEANPGAAADGFRDYLVWSRDAGGETYIIPAPAFAEFIAFFAYPQHQELAAKVIQSGLLVVPMDAKSAILAGRYRVEHFDKAFMKRMKAEHDISKQCVKTDIEIVATAKAHGASRIITLDTGVRTLALAVGMQVESPADCRVTEDKPRKPKSNGLFDGH